jgi:predicted nucleotidyltransferase
MVHVKDLLTKLCSHKAKFIIIGGQAAVLQGSAYLTADLDLCYDRDPVNLDRLVKALIGFHPVLREADKSLPFVFDTETLRKGLNFTLSTDIGDVDLLGEITGLGFYKQVIPHTEEMEVFGMTIRVLTLDGLIRSKIAAGRKKDILLLDELEAIKKLRKTGRKK